MRDLSQIVSVLSAHVEHHVRITVCVVRSVSAQVYGLCIANDHAGPTDVCGQPHQTAPRNEGSVQKNCLCRARECINALLTQLAHSGRTCRSFSVSGLQQNCGTVEAASTSPSTSSVARLEPRWDCRGAAADAHAHVAARGESACAARRRTLMYPSF